MSRYALDVKPDISREAVLEEILILLVSGRMSDDNSASGMRVVRLERHQWNTVAAHLTAWRRTFDLVTAPVTSATVTIPLPMVAGVVHLDAHVDGDGRVDDCRSVVAIH